MDGTPSADHLAEATGARCHWSGWPIFGPNVLYRFESEVPRPYERRPPHIHVRVAHPGYRTLVTQHYVARGETEATFDLVLTPAP